MDNELKFEFNNYVVAIDEPYKNDYGYVAIGKKSKNESVELKFKSPRKEIVEFFIKLQKYITDLEAKLAVADDCADRYWKQLDVVENENKELKAKLAEKEKEIEKCNDEWTEICDGKLETINRLIEEKHELEETIKSKSHNKWLKAEAERYKTEYQSLKGYIDQLKQQLAEKDQAIENWKTMYESVMQTCNNDAKEIDRLNKQLDEKEKEIDEVCSNHANLVADIAYKAVNVYTAESKKTGVPTFYKIHYSQLLEIEDMNNIRNYAQDKIEVAITELEKVKEKIYKILKSQKDNVYAQYDYQVFKPVIEEIDQQMKSLKGEKWCG